MSASRRFRSWALATIAAVYFLIFVGGLVRASGAGMGCPDWPKCFGRWVPPTSEAQLPANYQEIYAEHGYGDAPFNARKTWTEYVNRLIGATIGLLVLATVVMSWPLRQRQAGVFWWSVVAFLLVGFEGWLGSVVVETNLMPWVVTLHMVAALVVVAALLLALAEAEREAWSQERIPADRVLGWMLAVAIGLSVVQVALGTRVREGIDVLMIEAAGAREGWMAALGNDVLVHRSLSILVLVANVLLVWRIRGLGSRETRLGRCGPLLVGILALEALAGAGMYYFEVPAFLQPVHLVLFSVAAGLQLLMVVLYRCGSAWPRQAA